MSNNEGNGVINDWTAVQIPGSVVIGLGVLVAVFGLLPGVKFFTHYPTPYGIVKKPISNWSGRIWFVAGGALLVYWGLMHWRP